MPRRPPSLRLRLRRRLRLRAKLRPRSTSVSNPSMRIISSYTTTLAITIAITPLTRTQTATTEALFRESNRLMKEGDLAAACDKYETNNHLKPTTTTELNLTNYHKQNKQTTNTWETFPKTTM